MTTKTQVLNALDRFFAPNIRIKIDATGYITACMALTTNGANFLLQNAILDHNYDSICFGDVCVETLEESQ